MDKHTIDRISETVSRSKLNEQEQAELLGLLGKLRGEIETLAQTNSLDAQSIAGLAVASTNEAVRENPRPEVLEPSLDALTNSAKALEISHPSLVRVVNSICMMLSNIGI